MSMLLGPLSETISSVSWRDCALAGDQMAGADTAPPAANADADFRKSRRFIKPSPGHRMATGSLRKGRANSASQQASESLCEFSAYRPCQYGGGQPAQKLGGRLGLPTLVPPQARHVGAPVAEFG